jgi:hypothetical protein
MKKLLSIALTFAITLSCLPCTAGSDLHPSVTGFSLAPITVNNYVPKITFNEIVVPETSSHKLMLAFYNDGVISKITTFDISSKTTLKGRNNEILFDKTPEEIRFFTWDTNCLKPLRTSVNVLTPEVIEAANADVVTKFLTPAKKATANIRNNWLSSTDTALYELMDLIDFFVDEVIKDKDEHLLTSEYSRRVNAENFEILEGKVKALSKKDRDYLYEIYTNPEFPYADCITSMMKFLNLKIFPDTKMLKIS